MRFSRRRQRERAERAAADDEADAAFWHGIARWGPGPRPPRGPSEDIRPYRGFRRGRARMRPDPTGYDEPTSPDREQWAEPRAGDPTLDPVLGDSDDEPWTR
ncbi:hypothetical protein [Actinophytocola sp.]|uniref:hypothetical protein n=1 Tax=Actinophytocola sp. TaxID=1872138 RepID=UPI002ED456EC